MCIAVDVEPPDAADAAFSPVATDDAGVEGWLVRLPSVLPLIGSASDDGDGVFIDVGTAVELREGVVTAFLVVVLDEDSFPFDKLFVVGCTVGLLKASLVGGIPALANALKQASSHIDNEIFNIASYDECVECAKQRGKRYLL